MDYRAKQDDVFAKLKAKGLALVLRDPSINVDPITGMATNTADTDLTLYGLMLNYSQHDKDGVLVEQSDLKVMASAVQADEDGNPQPLTFLPKTGLQLIANEKVYRIINSEPFQPGGVPLFYNLQVRA